MPVSWVESASHGHFNHISPAERRAHPILFGILLHAQTALNLEFEKRSWAEVAIDLAHVSLDDFAAANVMEDAGAICEIKLPFPQYAKVRAAVLMYMHISQRLQRLPRLLDHFAADVDRVDFAEKLRESASHPAHSASYFEDRHLLRVHTLTDVSHVGKNVPLDRFFTGSIELIIGPDCFAVRNIVPAVLGCPLIPTVSHSCKYARIAAKTAQGHNQILPFLILN